MEIDRLVILADTPASLPEGERPTSRIQVAKTGQGFRDPRYGTFSITQADFDAWSRNLAVLPGGQAMIDLDHVSERGGSSEAAGWITGLDQKGEDGQTDTPHQLWATVQWTPVGATALRERRYRFFSPTYGAYRDEQGRVTKNVLRTGALTNRPFLRQGMAALSLSDGLPDGIELEAPSNPPASSDSRRRMEITPEILTALDLDDQADEATVLSAVQALAARPEKPEDEPKTLEQAEAKVREDGKVILSQEQFDAQVQRIQKLEQADVDRGFEDVYGKALTELRVDSKDETKALYRDLYEKDPDNTTKLLTSLPALASTEAAGERGEDVEAPDGVDPDSHALDQKVQARMKDKDEEYSVALDAVLADEEQG